MSNDEATTAKPATTTAGHHHEHAHAHAHEHGDACGCGHEHHHHHGHHHAGGATYQRSGAKVGRNDACPCGSGKKYKKCCLQAA